MFRIIFIIPLLISAFLYPFNLLKGQAVIHGKLLSVDGSPMQSSFISIQKENQTDIFERYDDPVVSDEGDYKFMLRNPGLYRITFRGVYHETLSIPLLIINQKTIEIDVLLFPFYFNDGHYFNNEGYLNWIRIVGNFNDYDYEKGTPFYLNDDGSISAFIPVLGDTVRYQVRGLTYGRGGSTPLPLADEYNIRPNKTFESVRYRNLPDDSLEIRYLPGKTIPYQRNLPGHVDNVTSPINGVVYIHDEKDKNWVWPIGLIRSFWISFHLSDQEVRSGIPADRQVEIQERYLDRFSIKRPVNEMELILAELEKKDLHPQQRAMLHLAYAATLNRIEMRKQQIERMKEMRPDSLQIEFEEIPEVEIEQDVITAIPELVSPAHPAWNYLYVTPQLLHNLLTTETDMVQYLHQIVEHHPNELVVGRMVTAILQAKAVDYGSVEEMEVYQIILKRFGEGDIARQAHRLFHNIQKAG